MADLRQRLQNQPKVQVARQTQQNSLAGFWFGALAAFTAGVFYFWYYFLFTSGSVLIGP